ncbi:MAG: flagellin [Nitrospirae bacterium]|nr:flagellin [Nitrospirota bacterium]
MAFEINTNIMSVNAQRNLMMTKQPLQHAVESLSSGLRINSAADDAAGLALATRMTSQTRGLAVSVRNANDGLSMVQTAEGSLRQITSNLQRMRELAVQASSGQYGASDVGSMQMEVNSLVENIGQIATQTRFNNRNLLDGTFSDTLAAGYYASDPQIDISVGSMNVDALGGVMSKQGGAKGSPLYLYDLHTSSRSSGLSGVGDNRWITTAASPAVYSSTAAGTAVKTPISYTGYASLLVNAASDTAGAIADTHNNYFVSRAQDAISVIDSALESVNSTNAAMGAKAVEFNAVITNLSNVIETTMAAHSRIMDADFAAETANMTKAAILQQSAISVLSQANTTPQSALALLK